MLNWMQLHCPLQSGWQPQTTRPPNGLARMLFENFRARR